MGDNSPYKKDPVVFCAFFVCVHNLDLSLRQLKHLI